MNCSSSLYETSVSFYLNDLKDHLIYQWAQIIVINKEERARNQIVENGQIMFDLTLKSLDKRVADQEIRSFAHKVAKERADSPVNISDFIFNVFKGRNLILAKLTEYPLSKEQFIEFNSKINDLYDRFIENAVDKYKEIKEKELEEKILFISDTHKDRLTLLGQMSSSFVHEFRNPLTSIMGFVKLLKAGQYKELYLDTIERELFELNFRITQFLHTSRIQPEKATQKEIIIEDLLDEILQFLYPSFVSEDIDIITNFQNNTKVTAIEEEIKQVLLNLLMNAIEAVKASDKKRHIRIVCRQDDEYIQISLSNNGPCIQAESLNTIFEPFYTTKELGTGIGLYVCKKIIEGHHNGQLTCASTEEQTTFTVRLPLSPPSPLN